MKAPKTHKKKHKKQVERLDDAKTKKFFTIAAIVTVLFLALFYFLYFG